MRKRLQQRICSGILRVSCPVILIVFCTVLPARAEQSSYNVLCRPDLASSRREELADHLRKITGWPGLDFDEHGALRLGSAAAAGGSRIARELLMEAVTGKNLIVLEDASNRSDVVFASVSEGRWVRDASAKPPVYIVLIDFADFSRVKGDKAALAALNAGWGVLHEINHVVHKLADADRAGEAGECEDAINQMRRECGLAERAEYYFSFLPGSLTPKFARLAFEQQLPESNKRKRYWLIWDADLVGGLSEPKQVASFK